MKIRLGLECGSRSSSSVGRNRVQTLWKKADIVFACVGAVGVDRTGPVEEHRPGAIVLGIGSSHSILVCPGLDSSAFIFGCLSPPPIGNLCLSAAMLAMFTL